MNKQERRLAKWNKIKIKGLMAYLLKMGLLYHGLTFFLIWTFLAPFIDNNYTFDFIYRETFKTKIIVCAIISPLYGFLMAYIGWKNFEKMCD